MRACHHCGTKIPPAQYLLEESGVLEGQAGSAAGSGSGSKPVPVRLTNGASRVARLGDRSVATVLDAVVLLSAFAVIDTWVFLRWGVSAGPEFHLTTAAVLLSLIFNNALFFLYMWLLEAGFGTTIGKAIMGITVTRDEGRNALKASAIRNALRVVDGIGFYLVGALIASCSRNRRRLGDMIAGTVVIETHFGAVARTGVVVLWMAVLAAAVFTIPHIVSVQACSTHRPAVLGRTVASIGSASNAAYVAMGGHRFEVRLSPVGGPQEASTAAPAPADSSVRN
jgi:uncharacterized RDD family membrane protein YckC